MRLFSVLLLFCSFLLPLRADWGLRMDVDGSKEKVPLKAAPGYEKIVLNTTWGAPADRKCRLFIQKKDFKEKETVSLKAGFIPEKSGHVRLILNGCYVKRYKMAERDKAWVDYLKISAEGTEIRNGDFVRRGKNGTVLDWALAGARLLPGSGVSAWNGGSVSQTLKVTKGVPVILTVSARQGKLEVSSAALPPKRFKAGSWELIVDGNTGAWRTLRHNGKTLSDSPSGVVSVTFNSLNPGGTPRLLKSEWDASKGKLVLTVREGDYDIRDIVTFGEYLEKRMELTNRGNSIGKVSSVNYSFQLPRRGRFLLPRSFFGSTIGHYKMFENAEQTGVTEGALKDMPDRFFANSVFDCPFAFYELEPNRTLTIISDTRHEACRHSLRGYPAAMSAGLYTSAAGWSLPGKTMHFGPQYLHVSAQPLEKALRSIPHQWYTKYNYLPPADRPAWVKKSAMYTLPVNPIQGNVCGVSGAEKHALPYLKSLGFNLLWIQPVEVAMMYGVQDFYRMRADSGTWEEYHRFTDAAHRENIRVLLDTTPHGGRPLWAKTRNLPPEVLIVNENGDFRSGESFDYSSPYWREYMRKVAEFDLKQTGVDGFRVDTGGNTGFSWRREGFPAKPSSNVDAKWFYSEIAKTGGKIRGIEYDKASCNSRQGPALLMETIRKETRKAVRDGIAASETEWLASVPVSDFIWDFYFRQFRFQFHRFTPEEFTSRFMRWLDEEYLTDPPGSLRLRFMELHGYCMPIELYAGDKAACAARSVLHLLHGIPMSLYGDGEGHGVWTRKWLKLRATLPELTEGKVDYSGVKSSPQMMTIARVLPGKSSVGIVSFYPEKRTAEITLPETALPFAENELLICRDALTGKTLAQGTRKDLKHLTLTMEPFGSCLPVFRRKADPYPAFPDDSLKLQAKQPEKPAVTETKEEIRIGSLVIDRGTGLLKKFGSHFGPMYRAGDKAIPQIPAKIKIDRGNADVCVTAVLPDAVLRYTYDGKALLFESEMSKADPACRSGFLFALPNADRYQIDGISGRLDDIYLKEQTDPSASGIYNNIHRRVLFGPLLWDSELRPLSPASPEFRFYAENRTGTAIRWEDPLSPDHDSFQLISRGPAGAMLHLAAWQCSPGPLSLVGSHPARKLKLVISDAAVKSAENAVLPKGITLDHQSLYWKFSTPNYTAKIFRTGGMMKELTFAGKKLPVISEQHAYSNQGKADYYTKTSKRFLTSRQDVETGSRLYMENGVLKLRFLSLLRDGTYWGVIMPPFWVRTEYEFSQDTLQQTLLSAIENGDIRYRYFLQEKNESGKTVETPLPVGSNAQWAPYSRIYSSSGIRETKVPSFRTVEPAHGRYFGMHVSGKDKRIPLLTAMKIPGWWFDQIFQSNTRLLPGINAGTAIEFQGGVDWGHFAVPFRGGSGKYRMTTTIRSENMRKGKGGKEDWLCIRASGSDAKGKYTKWEKRFSFPDGPGKTEKVTFDFEVPQGCSITNLMVCAYHFYDYGKVTVDLPELVKLAEKDRK